MKQPKYPRVGEYVRVVNPVEFIRVGYELTFDVLIETRYEEVKELARKAAEGMGLFTLPSELVFTGQDPFDAIDGRVRKYLEKAACAKIIRDEGFGGKERKIFEKQVYISNVDNWLVEQKKFVKTGTYSHGCGRWSHDGDYDYEPSSLANEQTHCVLYLKHQDIFGFITRAVNCERVLNG